MREGEATMGRDSREKGRWNLLIMTWRTHNKRWRKRVTEEEFEKL